MSDLRQRNAGEKVELCKKNSDAGRDEKSDEDGDDMCLMPDLSNTKYLPQDTGKTTEVLDATLKDVSPRWRNWIIRGIFTMVMILAFCAVVWLGPLYMVLLVRNIKNLLYYLAKFWLSTCYGLDLRIDSIIFDVDDLKEAKVHYLALMVVDLENQGQPHLWRNWIVRTLYTCPMLLFFMVFVHLGAVPLVFMILLIQIKCFHEIINIGYAVYQSFELPWFRSLSWYFLITSNYFFYGESLTQFFGVLMSTTEFLAPLVTYHRFISFSLYVGGLVAFVLSLKKKHYLKQFTLFGWTHVTLLIIVTQSHLMMQNIFEGLIWFLVPVTEIICNDIMAYMFGFFFGKTPLIKLSPKKTWEGFIGGAFATLVYGIIVTYILVPHDCFVCPIVYDEVKEALSVECERAYVFQLHDYGLPHFVQNLGALVGMEWMTVTTYPFVFHSISMAVFASVIGPFGGFFASGFKRAFKIKDFGDTIPGHGGFMDRFDCQLLMATFVHVYHSSFIKAVSPLKLVQTIMLLRPEEQLQVLNLLQDNLRKRGML